jgi:hypothetical protein
MTIHLISVSKVYLALYRADLDQYYDQYYLLTELDAIREVLFMLSGWSSVLFTTSKASIKVRPLQESPNSGEH